MVHSRVICFLALALCLFACVAASATPELSEDAKKTMEEAKNNTKQTCEKAETYVGNARVVSQRVEDFKRRAEDVKTKAGRVKAEAEQAAEGYDNAKDVVENIKNLFSTVSTFGSQATDELRDCIASTSELISEAESVKSECDIEVEIVKNSENNYTGKDEKITALKNKVGDLEKNITAALTILDRLDSTKTMEENAEKAQIKNFHVSAIVAVAKIATIMEEAHSIMQTTPTKKNEVSRIIQEMQELKATAPSGSADSIDALYQKAEAELNKATSALKRAETANEAIKEQKGLAETALTNVQKTDVDLNTAQKEAKKAKTCFTTVQQHVEQLKSEIKTAQTSATNATGCKEEMEQALLNAQKKPNTEQDKETTEANPPVGDGTDSHQKDTTIQPTSKELPSQSEKSTKEIKDTLINGAQNMPTTALTGGKAPAPGAKNDSAMTVSVPLLVALIASAVWQ